MVIGKLKRSKFCAKISFIHLRPPVSFTSTIFYFNIFAVEKFFQKVKQEFLCDIQKHSITLGYERPLELIKPSLLIW